MIVKKAPWLPKHHLHPTTVVTLQLSLFRHMLESTNKTVNLVLHFRCCNRIRGPWCDRGNYVTEEHKFRIAANETRITSTTIRSREFSFYVCSILQASDGNLNALYCLSVLDDQLTSCRKMKPEIPATSSARNIKVKNMAYCREYTHGEFQTSAEFQGVAALQRHWPAWASMGCRGTWRSSQKGQRWWWRPRSRWEHMVHLCFPLTPERNRTPDSPSPTLRRPAGSRLWTEDHRVGDVSRLNSVCLTCRPGFKGPGVLRSTITSFQPEGVFLTSEGLWIIILVLFHIYHNSDAADFG